MAGSTAYSTDHRLIRAKVAIRIAPKHRKQQTSRRRFDVGKLKDLDTSNQFKGDLQERLLSKPDDNLSVEQHWTHVNTALTDACKEAFGFKTKRHQDWFNENEKEINRLIESKRQAFTDWQNHRHCNVRKAKYHILRADVQREIRDIKDKWWIDKAAEIQGYADNHMFSRILRCHQNDLRTVAETYRTSQIKRWYAPYKGQGRHYMPMEGAFH